MKPHIAIISSSVRDGRLSHRVALFLNKYINENGLASSEILDLREYDFPIFHERLINQKEPSVETLDFAKRFNDADGIIIVSPVYNASFPAALKNVIDLLVKEWVKKPVAISTVTYGNNQAIATAGELNALLLKLGAVVSPTPYMPIRTGEAFDAEGNAADPVKTGNYAKPMIDDLIWLIEKIKN